VLATLLVAAAVGLLGVYLGLWWAPFPLGVATGVILTRARWALLAGGLSGLVAWTVPLIAEQVLHGLKETSLSLAAMMGFDGAATVPFALTLLVGLLLGLTGAWFGAAVKAVLPASLGPVQKLGDKRLEVKDPVLAKR
jgi:hypothetical protein